MLERIKCRFAIVNNRCAMAGTFKNQLGNTLVSRVVLRHKNSGAANFRNICSLLCG